MTGAALEGVQFTVTTADGEFVAVADGTISSNGVYYTDSNGRITLDGLKPDTYVITESATISGYVIDRTPHTIAVKANDTQTLTVTNRPRGGLIIMKLSRQTRQPLAGAEFRILPADESLFTDNEGLTSPNNLYVTDADGQISLSNLTPGDVAIMDNAQFHRKGALRKIASRHHVLVLFLPPYSPDCKPIEKLWANMKRWLRKNMRNCDSFEEALEDAIDAYS